jgi:hypothetical protein
MEEQGRIEIFFWIIDVTLFFWLAPRKKKNYVNQLGLKAMPAVEELGLKDSRFSSKNDEFVYLMNTLEQWSRNDKSFVIFVKDDTQKRALLDDLRWLEKLAFQELEIENNKEGKLPWVIELRKTFLEKTIPYQEGALRAWEPPISQEETFIFRKLNGSCVLVRKGGAFERFRFRFEEQGIYSVEWTEAGDIREEREVLLGRIKVDSRLSEQTVTMSPPVQSGTLYIINHARDEAFDRVPVS